MSTRELAIQRARAFLAALKEVGAPGYTDCEGNDSVLVSECNDKNVPATLQNLCEAFKRKEKDLWKDPDIPELKQGPLLMHADAALKVAEAEERLEALDEIVDSLQTSVDGRGRTVCMNAEGKHLVVYSNEVERLNNLSTQEILRIRDSRAEIERLRDLPTSELRKVANGNRPAMGYPALPVTIVRKGTIKPVSLDALYIKKLDGGNLKKLIRTYGPDAVNARLRGE